MATRLGSIGGARQCGSACLAMVWERDGTDVGEKGEQDKGVTGWMQHGSEDLRARSWCTLSAGVATVGEEGK